MPKLVKVEASLTKEKVAKLKKDDKDGNFAKLPDEGIGKVAVTYDFGATPQEAADYFGADIVMRLLEFAISHPIQSKIRDGLAVKVGKGTPVQTAVTEIQAAIYDTAGKKHVWKPGAVSPRMSAAEKLAKKLKDADPETRKREIAELTAMLDEMS